MTANLKNISDSDLEVLVRLGLVPAPEPSPEPVEETAPALEIELTDDITMDEYRCLRRLGVKFTNERSGAETDWKVHP